MNLNENEVQRGNFLKKEKAKKDYSKSGKPDKKCD